MTIATLSDLVSEIRDEMDDSAYSLSKIYRAIDRAETMFNRDLRVPQMETKVSLAVISEETALPSDLRQIRAVYQEGSPDSPLRSMSPQGLRDLYAGQSGTPAAYALENNRLIVGPVGSSSVTVLYYAEIAALTENNTTNWLLRDYPDLYLHQALAILFQKTGDRERAADHFGLATALIERVNGAGRKARWGAGPLTPALVHQVSGARI